MPHKACRRPLQITTNLLVKNTKRSGYGFRNFANYRHLPLKTGTTSGAHPITS